MSSISKLVVSISVLLAACSGSSAVSTVSPTDQNIPTPQMTNTGAATVLQIRLDETVGYEDMKLRWLEFNDLRCPKGVACRTAGRMIAMFEVTEGGNEPFELEVLQHADREPEITPFLHYELRILSVHPWPKYNVESERRDYVMRFEVRRL